MQGRPSLANLQAAKAPRLSPRPRGSLIAEPGRKPDPSLLASWTLDSSPKISRVDFNGEEVRDMTDRLTHSNSRTKLVVDDMALSGIDTDKDKVQTNLYI